MELNFGGIFARIPSLWMKAGEVVLGHAHNFDHPTFTLNGKIRLDMLDVSEWDVAGQPLNATVARSVILSCDDDQPGELVPKGRWHVITALEDRSRYMCIYASRMPQALSRHDPGKLPQKPYTIQVDGVTYYRDIEGLVTDKTMWAESFR